MVKVHLTSVGFIQSLLLLDSTMIRVVRPLIGLRSVRGACDIVGLSGGIALNEQ